MPASNRCPRRQTASDPAAGTLGRVDINAYMLATQQRLIAQGDAVSSVVLSGGTALVG